MIFATNNPILLSIKNPEKRATKYAGLSVIPKDRLYPDNDVGGNNTSAAIITVAIIVVIKLVFKSERIDGDVEIRALRKLKKTTNIGARISKLRASPIKIARINAIANCSG